MEKNTPALPKLIFQAVRYGAAAISGFLADYLLLWLLSTQCPQIHYLISAALAFVAGLAVNYIVGVTFVFKRDPSRSRTLELGVFLLISLVALGINELVLWGAAELFAAHVMLSKIFAGALTFLWNFFARRLILYPERFKK